MIKFDSLSKKFGERIVLDNINGEIGDCGIFLIKGKSGSGKSTIANILLGLMKPDEGKIIIDDYDYSLHEEKDNASFRFSHFSYAGEKQVLLNNLSLTKNLSLRDEFDKEEFLKLKKLFRFHEVDKPLYLLSGGNQKKAELIASLLKKSPILLLDEPFAFLDIDSKNNLRDILNSESKKRLVILISHETVEGLNENYRLSMEDKVIEKIESDNHVNNYLNNHFTVSTKFKKAATKSYIFSNKLLIILNFIFALVFSTLFLSGIVSLANSELRNPQIYSVERDTYEQFKIAINPEKCSYDKFVNQPLNSTIEIYGKFPITFIVSDDQQFKDDTIYANFDLSDASLETADGEIIPLNFESISADYFDFNLSNSFHVVAVSRNLFSLMLENGLFNTINTGQTPFYNDILEVVGSTIKYPSTNSSFNTPLKIITGDPYHLAVPGFAKDTKITLNLPGHSETFYTTAENDRYIEISFTLYQYILSANEKYTQVKNKSETIDLLKDNNFLEVVDIITPGYYLTLEISLIILAAAVFILILYVASIFIINHIKRNKRKEFNDLLLLNGFTIKKIFSLRFLFLGIEALIMVLIPFLVYLFVMIPYINNLFFSYKYKSNYAVALKNELYQNLPMLKFQTYSNFSLLILFPILLLFIVEFTDYIKNKKNIN